MKLGDRIKIKRQELGLSQDELAQKMGYSSRSAIAKIEKGVSDVSYKKVLEFAKILNTTTYYLLGKESEDKCYYLNSETKQIAKLAYERRSIRELFNIIKNLPDEDIEACAEFLKKINKIK